MKDRIVSHLNMVFQVLAIESTFEVYDCTLDKLPEWTNSVPLPYRYLICAPIVEQLSLLKKFLGKEIYVLGNMLYWYDGDAIEPIKSVVVNNINQEVSSIVNLQLKSFTRLPSWLDDFIFKQLHAEYAPNHKRFDYNLDLSEPDVLKYLGTYFPRSYAESFCIFDNLFKNEGFSKEFNINTPINIASIGCGTGGDLMGLLVVISKYSVLNRKINITAVDGNKEALEILFLILERYKQFYKKDISLRIIHHTFNDISTFNIDSIGSTNSFDFVICSKMISEIIASNNGENDNAYYNYVKQVLPFINQRGIFYLLDVTTRQKHSTFNPFLMNEQVHNAMIELKDYSVISPIPCSMFSSTCKNSCFYQKTFTIAHSHIREDKSKVVYKLIASKYLLQKIGCSLSGLGRYQIHGEKICPYTETLGDNLLDAFYIPEKPIKPTSQDVFMTQDKVSTISSKVEQDSLLYENIVDTESISLSKDDVCDTKLVDEDGENAGIVSEEDCYYTGCYIIDTNVFIEKPDIIDSIPDNYFIVLSAKVLEELDHLKIKKNMSVSGKKRANKALKNISVNLSSEDKEIIMEDSDVRLLPKDFNRDNPDNKILSVALKYIDENPILLTSDFGLQARARAMGIESISLKDYKKNNNN